MKLYNEESPLVEGLTSLKNQKRIKSTMKIRVHMQHDDGYESDYNQKARKKLKKEVESLEKQLIKFDVEHAASKVRKAIQTELAHKKAALMEYGDDD